MKFSDIQIQNPPWHYKSDVLETIQDYSCNCVWK